MGERRPAPSPLPGAAVRVPRAKAAGAEDLQSLLTRAVAQLAEETGARRVAAWVRVGGEPPRLLAARLEGAALCVPDAEDWSACVGLVGATDLGAADAPPGTRRLGERHGLFAAAPVLDADGGLAALLLLGGESEPAGQVRPRTLARLARAAERLRGPATSVAAAARLAHLDAAVQRLDRLASLGSLVAEIVHEIRNPLVSIKTFLQLLPEREDDPEFCESFREVASDEVRRIERLLEGLLEHARPAPEPRADALASVDEALASVLQVVAFRATDRGVTVEANAGGALPRAHLSADALRQVLLNLVLNAIEATPAGRAVRVSAHATEHQVVIDVEDEGPGVSEALRDRIFEPFFSTRAERPGGLGLAITRRLVEEAGGRIEVGAGATGGARFRVTLRRARR